MIWLRCYLKDSTSMNFPCSKVFGSYPTLPHYPHPVGPPKPCLPPPSLPLRQPSLSSSKLSCSPQEGLVTRETGWLNGSSEVAATAASATTSGSPSSPLVTPNNPLLKHLSQRCAGELARCSRRCQHHSPQEYIWVDLSPSWPPLLHPQSQILLEPVEVCAGEPAGRRQRCQHHYENII